jgi:hypothetical protein
MTPQIAEFIAFIQERHAIYIKKQKGLPKPWTNDEILQRYRFCNVYRELDAVTVWIRENWRQGSRAANKDIWFAMVVARWVNWPDTLAEVGFPIPWKPEKFISVLNRRKAAGEKIIGGAYMITTHGDKRVLPEFLTELLTDIWERRAELRPRKNDTLDSFCQRLASLNHFGTFMAAQVVADTKYTPCLQDAVDWWSWAAPGPGSRRGLNRVLGRPKDERWSDVEWLFALQKLHGEVVKALKNKLPKLHAQDLQNCLCEFDKYQRVKRGEGRPRATYQGV